MMTATSTSLMSPRSPSIAALQSPEAITQFERAVMKHLDRASIPELVRIGQLAHGLGGTAWRIECKAHAKLLEREHAKRGRGNKDSEGTGIKAAAFAAAELRGCHPRTVLRDAQIYRELLQNGGNDATELQEKSFYVIALAAHNPQRAIRRIAKMKRKRPDFSTRDARLLVEDMNSGRTPRIELATPDILKEHLDHVANTLSRDFIPNAPKADLVKRYYEDWKDDIDWERERLKKDKQNLKRAILDAHVKRGAFTEEMIAKELDRPLDEIKAATKEMIAEGVFTGYVREGGETEKQKGSSRRQLLRLKGAPLGNFYQEPRTTSHYAPPHDHDDDEDEGEEL